MKILVTGATGFIGSHVISMLIEKGYEIIGISRQIENKEYDNGKLSYIRIDATNKDELDGLNNLQIDAIVNCIGVLGRLGLPYSAYFDANFRTTKSLLEFAKRKKIEHFIHMSSTGVLGAIKRYECPVDEKYPSLPSNIYEETKLLAEREVKISGINYTILRPAFVYGPRDMHVLELFKVINRGYFILVDDGKAYIHPTYVDDVVSGVTLSLLNPRAYGNIYNIVGDRYVSIKDLTSIISNALDRKVKLISIPSSVLFPIARLLELLYIFKIVPPITTSRVRFFSEDRAFTYENAMNTIGYKPTMSLEEGIRKTVEWYHKNRYI